MNEIVSGLAQFVLYSVMALTVQNAVFSRSLGITRMVELVTSPGPGTLQVCGCLTLVQLLSAPLCWLCSRSLSFLRFRLAIRPLVFFLVTFLVCELLTLVFGLIFKENSGRIVKELLQPAAFNTCVLGTLLVCAVQNFTLIQYMGFALGSGVGYLLSVLLVQEGHRRLSRSSIPSSFRGLPIMLVYIGILSMAIYGLTGHSPAY